MVKSLSTKRSNNLNYSYCRHRSHHWFLNMIDYYKSMFIEKILIKNENHLNCFWTRNCASNDLWLPNDGLRQVPSSLQSLNGFFNIGFLVNFIKKNLKFWLKNDKMTRPTSKDKDAAKSPIIWVSFSLVTPYKTDSRQAGLLLRLVWKVLLNEIFNYHKSGK